MYYSSCLSRFLCQVNHLLHNVEVICFMHLSPIANTKWWYKVKTDGVGQKTQIHSFSLHEPMVRLRILSNKRLKKVQFWDIILLVSKTEIKEVFEGKILPEWTSCRCRWLWFRKYKRDGKNITIYKIFPKGIFLFCFLVYGSSGYVIKILLTPKEGAFHDAFLKL